MGVEFVTNLERDVVGPQQRDQQECGSHNGRTRCVAKENDGYPSNGTAIANETSKSKSKICRERAGGRDGQKGPACFAFPNYQEFPMEKQRVHILL